MGSNTEELIDPFCDPNNPVVIPFQEISAAAYKIKSGIERTPCVVSMNNVAYIRIIGETFRGAKFKC